jgi:hypothetical protein
MELSDEPTPPTGWTMEQVRAHLGGWFRPGRMEA